MGARTTALTHIRRAPYQALVAVLTLFVTLLLAGTFFLISMTSSVILSYFESKPQITVFFNDKATKNDADGLKATLEQTGKTAGIVYVSREEALAIYREQNKDDPLLLEMVTADILPASLEVSATDPTYLRELEPIINNATGVEEVVYQKDVVDALISWTQAVRIVGIVLVGLLSINSFLVVMTVIGMKIALRRDEVEILSLVGASPWYVRLPFLFEGAWYGLSGSVAAWGILTLIVVWAAPYLGSFLGDIPPIAAILSNPVGQPFLLSSLVFFVGLTGTGLLLGAAASWVALTRFLKV